MADRTDVARVESSLPRLATAQQSLKALDLLVGWRAHEPVPQTATVAVLEQSISGLASLLEPASVEALAIALDRLLAFARAFNVPVSDRATVLAIYRDTLADLPSDLIVEAVGRATRNWTWGNRLPMPGDLRKTIEPELFARTAAHGRHKVALLYAKDRERAAVRPEDAPAYLAAEKLSA